MIWQAIAAMAAYKLRQGGGGGTRPLAVGPSTGAAAVVMVTEQSWILNYVIYLCFCLIFGPSIFVKIRPYYSFIIGHLKLT